MTDPLADALREEIARQVVAEVERALAGREPRSDPSPWLTVAEAAEILRVPRGTIDNMTAGGRLTRHHLNGGRKVLLSRAEVEALVRRDRQ